MVTPRPQRWHLTRSPPSTTSSSPTGAKGEISAGGTSAACPTPGSWTAVARASATRGRSGRLESPRAPAGSHCRVCTAVISAVAVLRVDLLPLDVSRRHPAQVIAQLGPPRHVHPITAPLEDESVVRVSSMVAVIGRCSVAGTYGCWTCMRISSLIGSTLSTSTVEQQSDTTWGTGAPRAPPCAAVGGGL
jgi:hypothetical protein